MSPIYETAEYKFTQFRSAVSGADALYVGIGPVPDNTLWTVRAATIRPSVGETRNFWFGVQVYPGWPVAIPITWPTSLAATGGATGMACAFVKEGMEFTLAPGETLYGFRDVATAGSTITLSAAIVVSDLPIFRYTEPLAEDRKKKMFNDLIAGRGRFFRGRGGGGSGLPGLMPGGGGPGPRPK